MEDIPEEVWDWLENKYEIPAHMLERQMQNLKVHDFEELQKMLEERLKKQKKSNTAADTSDRHGGTSPFGHGGYNAAGVRYGGGAGTGSAVQVAGGAEFPRFPARKGSCWTSASLRWQFQLTSFPPRTRTRRRSWTWIATIQRTCDNAGNLGWSIFTSAKNTVGVLLLFDSDGSMRTYSRLCSQLFQAAHKSNHFKDLRSYLFS